MIIRDLRDLPIQLVNFKERQFTTAYDIDDDGVVEMHTSPPIVFANFLPGFYNL